MDRHQHISLGGRWGMGFISIIVVVGMTLTAVWVIPQSLPGVTDGQMIISKETVKSGDLILEQAMTSGIILSYSFQPWGGALSHQPTERLCPRELGEHPAVRAGLSLIPSSRPGEITKKDSHIKRSEGAFPSKSGPPRREHAGMKQHLHRT